MYKFHSIVNFHMPIIVLFFSSHSDVFSSMKQAFHNRLEGFKRWISLLLEWTHCFSMIYVHAMCAFLSPSFCGSHSLEIPSVVAQLLDLNLAIAPTEAVTQSIQTLLSVIQHDQYYFCRIFLTLFRIAWSQQSLNMLCPLPHYEYWRVLKWCISIEGVSFSWSVTTSLAGITLLLD